MADNIPITPGTGATIAADECTDGVLGTVKAQIIKIWDGTLDSVNKLIVTAAGAAKVDPSAAWDKGINTGGTLTQRMALDSAQFPAALGQAAKASSVAVAVANDQTWPTGMSPRAFGVAFSTLTRPGNQAPYSSGDSISDTTSTVSVQPLSATVSDTNDDPLTLTEILIDSTDTGLAGKKIRAYLYRSDPTASAGVQAGDNAAFSNKKAGYIGSMSGILETGFIDGTVGRLAPDVGAFIVTKPSSGGKTLWVQYQALDNFTPSANSTTIIGTLRGFQGRAS